MYRRARKEVREVGIESTILCALITLLIPKLQTWGFTRTTTLPTQVLGRGGTLRLAQTLKNSPTALPTRLTNARRKMILLLYRRSGAFFSTSAIKMAVAMVARLSGWLLLELHCSNTSCGIIRPTQIGLTGTGLCCQMVRATL